MGLFVNNCISTVFYGVDFVDLLCHMDKLKMMFIIVLFVLYCVIGHYAFQKHFNQSIADISIV